MEFDKFLYWSKYIVFIQSIFLILSGSHFTVKVRVLSFAQSYKMYMALLLKNAYLIYDLSCVNTSGQHSGHACSFGFSALTLTSVLTTL